MLQGQTFSFACPESIIFSLSDNSILLCKITAPLTPTAHSAFSPSSYYLGFWNSLVSGLSKAWNSLQVSQLSWERSSWFLLLAITESWHQPIQ